MDGWMKYLRRHEANVFNAIFYDKEAVGEVELETIIRNVALFFDLPVPVVVSQCEGFAEILVKDKYAESELSYNMEMLRSAGINNRDALTLCFVHEMGHQLMSKKIFRLFDSERWIQELAADMTAALYAKRFLLATGKYKYAVSVQKASETHPSGQVRKDAVEFAWYCMERTETDGCKFAQMVADILPTFVFRHYATLQKDYQQMKQEIKSPPPPPKEYALEDLPDSNLIKQAVMKYRRQNKQEDVK